MIALTKPKTVAIIDKIILGVRSDSLWVAMAITKRMTDIANKAIPQTHTAEIIVFFEKFPMIGTSP